MENHSSKVRGCISLRMGRRNIVSRTESSCLPDKPLLSSANCHTQRLHGGNLNTSISRFLKNSSEHPSHSNCSKYANGLILIQNSRKGSSLRKARTALRPHRSKCMFGKGAEVGRGMEIRGIRGETVPVGGGYRTTHTTQWVTKNPRGISTRGVVI